MCHCFNLLLISTSESVDTFDLNCHTSRPTRFRTGTMSSQLPPSLRGVCPTFFQAPRSSRDVEPANLAHSCNTTQTHVHFWEYSPTYFVTDSDLHSNSSSWTEDSDVNSEILSSCFSQLSDSTSTEAPCVPNTASTHVGGLTQEENTYAKELEQRRKFAPVTASELSDIQEARARLQIDVRTAQQRVNETMSTLTTCRGLLQGVEEAGDCEDAAEQQPLKSGVRVLEMNLEETNAKLECEKRALQHISRRALEMQNELDLQMKLSRYQQAEEMWQCRQRGEDAGEMDSYGRRVVYCSICMDEIVRENGDALALPCAHVFHEECVSMWLRRRKRCPTCQVPVGWQT